MKKVSIGRMAELSSKHGHLYLIPAKIRNGKTSVQIKYLAELIMFLIKKQKYLSNNFQFPLFSAKIIATQREPFENISANASKTFR